MYSKEKQLNHYNKFIEIVFNLRIIMIITNLYSTNSCQAKFGKTTQIRESYERLLPVCVCVSVCTHGVRYIKYREFKYRGRNRENEGKFRFKENQGILNALLWSSALELWVMEVISGPSTVFTGGKAE